MCNSNIIMRIDKTTDIALFNQYEWSKKFSSMSQLQKKDLMYRWVKSDYDRLKETIITYLGSNDLNPQNMDEVYSAFADFHLRAKGLRYKSFRVEVVSSPFVQAVENNLDKLLNCFKEESYYQIFGECYGCMLIESYLVSYSILEDGSQIDIIERTNADGDVVDYFMPKNTLLTYSNEEYKNTNATQRILTLFFGVLSYKKYGETETIYIASGVKREIPDDDGILMNRAPFPITHLDSSWFKTIIRTEGFKVRGHFRLQPYGEGRKERKLIYIEDYEKHGYTRTAKKLLSEGE